MEGRLIGIHSRVGPQLPVNMHVPIHVFVDNWEKMMDSEFVGEGPFAQQPKKGTGFIGIATKDVEGGPGGDESRQGHCGRQGGA